ncbi:hypothetical protein [Glycomyces buryatensis]|uniref:Exo-alpha-sialidase n=1 Tax=Glycomyces buryatensis TaxID=2570927 RepID=A0A4S8QNJ1_9ACTN|nr:hypothetical protein [Glycomyces buryatensis]THV43009.1 hypothetical protein FAB82_03380 [Glycomyces buryatensis]
MAALEPSGLTRRTMLIGAAAMLAAGAVAPRAAGTAGTVPQIRSVAARGSELIALTADASTDDNYALQTLTVDGQGQAALGPALPMALPADFHPHSIAARAATIWVTGVIELAADRARPGLVRILSGRAAYVALPVPEQIRSGAATAIALPGEGTIAVAVEGSPDEHLALISRSHLAVSADDGRTWTHRPLADGLGEGYGTALADTGSGLFAVVAAYDGAQTVYTGAAEAPLTTAVTLPDAGRPMAVVSSDAYVSVFSERSGAVHEARFHPGGAALESLADCGCAGEIVAVQGRPGAWIEYDDTAVRTRGL